MIGILLNDTAYEQDIRELLMAFYPGQTFAHEMQIQFDSNGKDHLETSEDVITEWIEQVKVELNK